MAAAADEHAVAVAANTAHAAELQEASDEVARLNRLLGEAAERVARSARAAHGAQERVGGAQEALGAAEARLAAACLVLAELGPNVDD